MLMTEIRMNNYKPFQSTAQVNGEEISSHQSTAISNAYKYIDKIASIAGIDVSAWDIDAIFKNVDAGFIHTRQADINKRFFIYLDELKFAPKSDEKKAFVIDKELSDRLKGYIERTQASRKQDLHLRRSRALERARELQQNIAGHIAEARNHHLELQAYGEQNSAHERLCSQIAEILSDNFWEFVNIDSDSIMHFLTKPITLTYTNRAQAADLVVPMGIFHVELSLQRGMIRKVRPQKDNIFYNDEYYHPHVSSSGDVCFGEVFDRYSTAAASHDFVTVMQITKSVLTTYCTENPYIHLHDFRNQFEGIEDEEEYNDDDEPELESVFDDSNDFDEEPPAALRIGDPPTIEYTITANGSSGSVTIPNRPFVSTDTQWTITLPQNQPMEPIAISGYSSTEIEQSLSQSLERASREGSL